MYSKDNTLQNKYNSKMKINLKIKKRKDTIPLNLKKVQYPCVKQHE